MSHSHQSFFHRRQKLLLLLSSLYVLGLILSHATLPAVHVWIIAAFFSILMNFTYVTEAFYARDWLRREASVAAFLIVLSLLGVLVHPVLVIAAIFGHGAWDLSKHLGAGVPFVTWYTLGCLVVDWTYGAVLLVYWWGQ